MPYCHDAWANFCRLTTGKAKTSGTRADVVQRDVTAAVITKSTGSGGDCYDNALVGNVNGSSYENELIHNRCWNNVLEVEIATFEWVTWPAPREAHLSNTRRHREPVLATTQGISNNGKQGKRLGRKPRSLHTIMARLNNGDNITTDVLARIC